MQQFSLCEFALHQLILAQRERVIAELMGVESEALKQLELILAEDYYRVSNAQAK